MSWASTQSEFNRFAATYDLLYRETRAAHPLFPLCRETIDRLRPRTILDCACGQGGPAIALAKEGFSVAGTDISDGLVRIARRHAAESNVSVSFRVAAWHELPRKIHRKFDFVMCHGNAIGHCKGERAMMQALRGMRRVLRKGGYLYVDTRAWEQYRTRGSRYRPGFSCQDAQGRHTILFRDSIPPQWSQPHGSEIVHLTETKRRMTVSHFRVTFYPFRKQELLRRLRRTGFEEIRTEPLGEEGYSVVGRAS